jgi:23S rRNA (cytidine1920-2'-O)/16S rRNA (cytidine1409-2'-O)-methyltransferase
VRLDVALVDRGLVDSRSEAAALIDEGRVLVNGAVALKAARQVAGGDPIVLLDGGPAFVSRGGKKLAGALEVFAVDPKGRTAVDAGSSTGGFTDCLLQHGALGVLAVDVGYGQLHERLRADDRVVSLERTNIRAVDRDGAVALLAPLPAPSLVVADLSFTSVIPICDRLIELAGPMGEVIVLCKPQFEVGREVAARGRGVIRSDEDREGALRGVIDALGEAGVAVAGVAASPILGPAGNAEFLVHAGATLTPVEDPDAAVMGAIDAARGMS